MLLTLTEREMADLKDYIKNYKNEFREKLSVPGTIKFGCEVEFNTYEEVDYFKDRVDDRYQIMLDGSGYDIVEVVSPIMHNTKEDWIFFKNILSKLTPSWIGDNSGGHIHYDASILKNENIATFLKLWFLFEDTIYDFASGEFEQIRKSADFYAERLKYLDDVLERNGKNNGELSPFRRYGRHCGINVASHVKCVENSWHGRDTYEVRVPNGSLNVAVWQNNVEFFARLFRFANDSGNKILIDNLYKNGKIPNEFNNRLLLADLIYDNEESKIRFLNQFELKNNFFERTVITK